MAGNDKHRRVLSEVVMRIRYYIVIGLALLPLFLCSAQAAEQDHPEVFAKEFVDAIRSKNVERREALLHPKSRDCIDSQSKPLFDWVFDRQLKYEIPDDYKVAVTPIPAEKEPVSDERFDFPVRPTHQVQIDFKTGPNSGVTIVLLVVYDGTSWYEVMPCPSPGAISQFQEAEAKRREQEQRARALADSLSGQLREEIITLAREGHSVEAIKKLAEASGENMNIAKYAVDILVPRD